MSVLWQIESTTEPRLRNVMRGQDRDRSTAGDTLSAASSDERTAIRAKKTRKNQLLDRLPKYRSTKPGKKRFQLTFSWKKTGKVGKRGWTRPKHNENGRFHGARVYPKPSEKKGWPTKKDLRLTQEQRRRGQVFCKRGDKVGKVVGVKKWVYPNPAWRRILNWTRGLLSRQTAKKRKGNEGR